MNSTRKIKEISPKNHMKLHKLLLNETIYHNYE